MLSRSATILVRCSSGILAIIAGTVATPAFAQATAPILILPRRARDAVVARSGTDSYCTDNEDPEKCQGRLKEQMERECKSGSGTVKCETAKMALSKLEEFRRDIGRRAQSQTDMSIGLIGSAGAATDTKSAVGAGALLGFQFSNVQGRLGRYEDSAGRVQSYLWGIEGQVQAGLGALTESEGEAAFRTSVLSPLVQQFNFGVTLTPQWHLPYNLAFGFALPMAFTMGRIVSSLPASATDPAAGVVRFDGSVVGLEIGPQFLWTLHQHENEVYALNLGAAWCHRGFTDTSGAGEGAFFARALGSESRHSVDGLAMVVGFQVGKASAQFLLPYFFRDGAIDGLTGWTTILRVTVNGELISITGGDNKS